MAKAKIAKGMWRGDRCRFCGELGEKVEPYLCDACRDKIFDWINQHGWTLIQTEKPTKDIGDYIRELEESKDSVSGGDIRDLQEDS